MAQSRCTMSLAMCPEPGYWKLELRPRQQAIQYNDYLAYSYPLHGNRSVSSLSRLISKGSVKFKPLLRNLSAYTKEASTAISQLRRDSSRPRNLDFTEDFESMYEAPYSQPHVATKVGYTRPHPAPEIDTSNVLRVVNRNSQVISSTEPSSPLSPCPSTDSSDVGVCSLSHRSADSVKSPTPCEITSTTTVSIHIQEDTTSKHLALLPEEVELGDEPADLPSTRIRSPRLQTRAYMESRRDRSRSMFLNLPGDGLPDILKVGTRCE